MVEVSVGRTNLQWLNALFDFLFQLLTQYLLCGLSPPLAHWVFFVFSLSLPILLTQPCLLLARWPQIFGWNIPCLEEGGRLAYK